MNSLWQLIISAAMARAEEAVEVTGIDHPRMFSIADLHGDFNALSRILGQLGLAEVSMDAHHSVTAKWTGEDAVVVSTGDSVDRGIYSKEIYHAWIQLADQAKDAGGRIVNMIGNHELMNLQGDVRFVHEAEMELYGGAEERARIWSPGSWLYDDFVGRYNAAKVVGDTLFVHGGLEPGILYKAMQMEPESPPLDTINRIFRESLAEGFDQPPSHQFMYQLLGRNGPFWSRHFPDGDASIVCNDLQQTLELVGAKRMVLGHTIQTNGVVARCDGALLLADTAISSAYSGLPGRRTSCVEYGFGGVKNVTVRYFDGPEYEETDPTHDEL
jgi:hypothetical protein